MRTERGKPPVGRGMMKTALLMLFILFMYSAVADAVIKGGKHDFSGKGWGTDESCIFCHTPHNASAVANVGSNPMDSCAFCHGWGYGVPKSYNGSQLCNRKMSTAVYTVYSSSSLKNTPQQPRGPSKLCLSCHDGTIAIDSYGMRTGTSYVTGSKSFGNDLSKMHPISIKWDHQTTKFGHSSDFTICYKCHHEQPLPQGANPVRGLPFYGYPSQMFLECGSCHEPHGKFAYPKFLREDMTGSKLCLECHEK